MVLTDISKSHGCFFNLLNFFYLSKSEDKLICLADLYNLPLDKLVGRTPIDEDARFKEYIMSHHANDISVDENDDISAIVVRYLQYVEGMGLDATQCLNGLQEIFLK